MSCLNGPSHIRNMMILASQHFANLHRIKFPLHSILFENKMGIGRQEQ